MPVLKNQEGFAQILMLLILVAGLGAGLFLVTHPTIFKPKASGGTISYIPETSFHLSEDSNAVHPLGQEFTVTLEVRSDTDAANLFTAKMQFPPQYISVSRIETENSFVKNWVENHYDNSKGSISLIGGVPTPGFGTKIGEPPAVMARITFMANHPTSTLAGNHIVFTPDSAIYRNTDNVNILSTSKDFLFGIVALTPSPSISNVCQYACVRGTTCIDGQCVPLPSPLAEEGGNCGVNGNPPQCQGGLICRVEIAPCTSAEGPYCDRAYPAFGRCIKPSPQPSPSPVQCGACYPTANGCQNQTCGTGVNGEVPGCTQTCPHATPPPSPSPVPSATPQCKVDSDCANYPQPAVCSKQGLCLHSEPPPPVCASWQTQCPGTEICHNNWEFWNPCPQLPSPRPSPVLSIKGDGNHDGVVNLVDLSVLLSNFGKTIDFPKEIDLKVDGQINGFDYSEMINLLKSLGIVAL